MNRWMRAVVRIDLGAPLFVDGLRDLGGPPNSDLDSVLRRVWPISTVDPALANGSAIDHHAADYKGT
jgi:hypothetical protein